MRTEQLEENMKADVAAYEVEKSAEAEQNSAAKKANATITLAEADKQAKELTATGQRAVEMVPVEVDREKVKVEDDRVTVKIKDLEGQATFESIARELQVELAKIAAEKEARIAQARAMAEAFSQANINVWGDPSAVENMSRAFYLGQGAGMFADGLVAEGNNVIATVLERLGIDPKEALNRVKKGNGGTEPVPSSPKSKSGGAGPKKKE